VAALSKLRLPGFPAFDSGRRKLDDGNSIMRSLLVGLLAAACSLGQTVGPSRGALVIAGGGDLGPEILHRFIELADGPGALVVVIPTAQEDSLITPEWLKKTAPAKAGLQHLIPLHTRDRAVADSEEFAAPLRKARGVWFEGGRQWRLVDAYLGTRTERELFALLERGGVIGGSSAGATIQGSYLVRGAREGNTIMMAPGYEEGMGFLRNTAIDQHLLVRQRQDDLVPVVRAHPLLLGIGIDERTAIVVQGDHFQVVGSSKVAIYEAGKPYYFLVPGDGFDLAARRKTH
jgi:cyanophycinase